MADLKEAIRVCKQMYEAKLADRSYTNGQVYAIMAIMIAGIVGFMGIYNAGSAIDKSEIEAENKSPKLQQEKHTQRIVMITLACIAIVFGIMAAMILKNKIWVFIPIGIVGAAFIGFSYSLGQFLRPYPKTKLTLSIVLLFIVIIACIFVGIGSSGPQFVTGQV